MNAAYQQPQVNPQMTQQQPQVVEAKFSYMPLILTTILTSTVALGMGVLFSRWQEKKKEADDEKREREREERAGMMPPMPMMWPGAGSIAANGNPGAAPPGPPSVPAVPQQTQAQLSDIVDRLGAWQEDLKAREAHLELVG